MGYHVAILRTDGGKRRPIAADELAAAVATVDGPGFDPASGTVAPTGDGEARAGLFLDRGEVWTNNPDRDTLALMIRFAEALGGRVRGDEFETYRTPDETYVHPHDRAEIDRALRATRDIGQRTRRRQLLLNAAIFGTFLALALIVGYWSRR